MGILLFGSAALRRPAEPADPADPATAACLDAMWRLLEKDGGVGLAAPQVGVGRRLVVVRDPRLPTGRQRLDLVNPEIVERFGAEVPFEEGCLSFPGLFFPVTRPQGVEVRWQSTDGQAVTLRDDGIVARIIQHEVDHLDGVLFIDHLGAWGRALRAPRLLWYRLRARFGSGGNGR
jgi:peptide deformylase